MDYSSLNPMNQSVTDSFDKQYNTYTFRANFKIEPLRKLTLTNQIWIKVGLSQHLLYKQTMWIDTTKNS